MSARSVALALAVLVLAGCGTRAGAFTYVVHLSLAGTAYTGTARWPADTDEEITPAVPLAWTPALPGYAG